ncbi:MAG: hypothetical protein AAF982_09325 [Pseudomonadota bacterium]
MTIQTTYTATRFLACADAYIRSQGVFPETGADFSSYAHQLKAARPERPIANPFCPARHFLGQGNGFWILGRDRYGEVVHTQAMRRIDLADQPLSDFLTGQFHQFPLAEPEPDLAKARYRAGPGARRIAGDTCYHGDFWLTKSYRGTRLSAALSRFAQALCLLHWRPDYVFGFMPDPIAFGGLAEREGYMHTEPFSLRWRLAATGKTVECFLVWQSRADIEHIIGGSVTGDGFE